MEEDEIVESEEIKEIELGRWRLQEFKDTLKKTKPGEAAGVDEVCRGGSRIFFRRGCTRLLLYFNTNKPHIFFFAEYQLY